MKYFLHDTNAFQDEKITELFMQFGYEGLGLFYTILEKIALQEKPIKTTVLKRQLQVGKRLEKCWSFMEEIGMISSSNGETFNERILSYSETYQIKKEKNRKRISEHRERQADEKNVTRNESARNTPKVNKSKVKESKENNTSAERGGIHEKVIEVYCDFMKTRTGVNPKIDGAAGSAVKSIIAYLTKISEEKNQGAAPEKIESETVHAWEFLLSQWGTLDEWLQNQVELRQINSNLNKIIDQIKNKRNGTAKNQQSSGRKGYGESVNELVKRANRSIGGYQ